MLHHHEDPDVRSAAAAALLDAIATVDGRIDGLSPRERCVVGVAVSAEMHRRFEMPIRIRAELVVRGLEPVLQARDRGEAHAAAAAAIEAIVHATGGRPKRGTTSPRVALHRLFRCFGIAGGAELATIAVGSERATQKMLARSGLVDVVRAALDPSAPSRRRARRRRARRRHRGPSTRALAGFRARMLEHADPFVREAARAELHDARDAQHRLSLSLAAAGRMQRDLDIPPAVRAAAVLRRFEPLLRGGRDRDEALAAMSACVEAFARASRGRPRRGTTSPAPALHAVFVRLGIATGDAASTKRMLNRAGIVETVRRCLVPSESGTDDVALVPLSERETVSRSVA